MVKHRHRSGLSFVEERRDYTPADVIAPYRPGPVFLSGHADLVPMSFSLVPAWSKERRVKFATHNARLDSINEKPTWKSVFVRRHCVVPISEFYEPIYEGEFAGNMVTFSRQDHEVLLAAGVWDEWVDHRTGEILQSYAIITHDPPDFIARAGHDRCPVFLKSADAETWLANAGEHPDKLKAFLLERQAPQDFHVEKLREMKPGWEKRK
jgi:putative SOS response-associated peptidase YedK